ncbi:TetR/AcrR family transcriptional regulator [Streptomyces atratus]|uniref:TetR/AcrR family transcriptional regulator n=1 Tax=Streptomyces atratus TaxID=1893 RepID=UPI0033E7CADB
MTPAAAPPNRAYRRLSVQERRTQLLGAALTLFAHRAPDEVSLDEVAAVAGVSRPLVYRYFPGGRQQLYEAALRSAADELKLCFAEPPEDPPTERAPRRRSPSSGTSRRRFRRAAGLLNPVSCSSTNLRQRPSTRVTTDEETASVVAALLSLETASGPAGKLAARLVPVVGGAAHLLPPD